jgi:hypothetical protein
MSFPCALGHLDRSELTQTATLFDGMLPSLDRVARRELVPWVAAVTVALPCGPVTTGEFPPDTVAPDAGSRSPESSNWTTVTWKGTPGFVRAGASSASSTGGGNPGERYQRT